MIIEKRPETEDRSPERLKAESSKEERYKMGMAQLG